MRVTVLLGGSSPERDVSLATGRGVVAALAARGHRVVAVDPADGRRVNDADLAGTQIGETPAIQAAPGDERSLVLAEGDVLCETDVVFVALHGGIGEDGTLQALLDLAGVPYTGSGMLACALAMDKTRAKQMMAASGVDVPRGALLDGQSGSVDPGSLGGFPIVVKPNAQGSSVGVHVVRKPVDLEAALADAGRFPPVLVEEYIPGRELTVAVLGGRALPAVEIVLKDGFYDYRNKYSSGTTRYVAPAEIPEDVAREMARQGEAAYRALGCGGVARVDFRLSPEGRMACLEVNTIPGMTATSLVPMAAKAAGIEYDDLVERLVMLAVEGAPAQGR